MKRLNFVQRAKKGLFLGIIAFYFTVNPPYPASTLCNMGIKDAHAVSLKIPAECQSAMTRIKSKQTAAGSIISEHINVKSNGYVTVKMLEIPEHQISQVIEQWEILGNRIDKNTIHDDEFIHYLVNNADVRSFSLMAKVPRLFFLVKNELAEPVLYGGEVTKFWKTITFSGWLKVAGALDSQGNYKKGFEHLVAEKDNIIGLFKKVLSNTVTGSYTIVELYTDGNGERKGMFKFYKSYNLSTPTFVRSLDVMAAFGLTYLNLVPENPDDIGVKEDLTKPIVEKLISESEVLKNTLALMEKNDNKPFHPDS